MTDMENTLDALAENEVAMPEEAEEKIKNAVLLDSEDDILKGLLKAANFEADEDLYELIHIRRGDEILIKFTIHPVSAEVYDRIREENTKYEKSKVLGTRIPKTVNEKRMRAQLIYEATIPEDQEKVWHRKDAWRATNQIEPISFVQKCLLPGEVESIVDLIDKISGFNGESISAQDEKEIDTVKN